MTDQYPGNTTARPVHPQDARPMADRGTTVVNNDRSSSTGWAIALLVAVVLGIGAVFMFTDFSLTGDSDTTAPTTSAPATSAPATDAAPAAPATPAPSTDAAPAAPAPAAPAPSTTPAPAGQ